MTPQTSWFRYALGFLVVLGGMIGFASLVAYTVPSTNRDAVMLALGVILGWGSSVVSFEFGSTSSGRALGDTNAGIVKKAAESTPMVRGDLPTGKPGDPLSVKEE